MRGTSRREEGLAAIEAAGIEPALADPDRPGTVLDLVGDVAVVFWLLGSARASPEELAAIHGPRLDGCSKGWSKRRARLCLRGGGSVDAAAAGGRRGAVEAAREPGGSRSRSSAPSRLTRPSVAEMMDLVLACIASPLGQYG